MRVVEVMLPRGEVERTAAALGEEEREEEVVGIGAAEVELVVAGGGGVRTTAGRGRGAKREGPTPKRFTGEPVGCNRWSTSS